MILLLTPYSFKPLHPRLEYIEKCLLKKNYEVKKFNLNCNNRIINKSNWLSLTFFQVPAFFKSIKYIWLYRKETNLIYIQDLQYLHISIIAKIFRKKVIYETLDHNAELRFYHLSNRYQFFRRFSLIKQIIIFLEKMISNRFCDEIIVNSKALVEYLDPLKSNLIYYTSPFENKFISLYRGEIAFLYLGGFLRMKGADKILQIIEQYNIKLFIFGTIDTRELNIISKMDELQLKGLVIFSERLPSWELEKELEKLFYQYRLIGFSLTQEVNKSNATQEINKDIDYLAMGIPIIANHRKPTEEKILEGCGVFAEDKENFEKLINYKDIYQEKSNCCVQYYNKYYSQIIFEEKISELIKNLIKVD
jgi:hypothetical protein